MSRLARDPRPQERFNPLDRALFAAALFEQGTIDYRALVWVRQECEVQAMRERHVVEWKARFQTERPGGPA